MADGFMEKCNQKNI